jgi:hypothetical protein
VTAANGSFTVEAPKSCALQVSIYHPDLKEGRTRGGVDLKVADQERVCTVEADFGVTVQGLVV